MNSMRSTTKTAEQLNKIKQGRKLNTLTEDQIKENLLKDKGKVLNLFETDRQRLELFAQAKRLVSHNPVYKDFDKNPIIMVYLYHCQKEGLRPKPDVLHTI